MEVKIVILIPTFNNAGTLENVLREVILVFPHVMVVNDGSTDGTLKVLNSFPSIHMISYEKNQGKGYALRRGFEEAARLSYTHAISIDSDGQHYASDIEKFVHAIQHSPNALIVGNRNMQQDHIPVKSNFGRKFSNFWYWAETGIRLNDTQSGFRAYPVHLLKNVKFYTKKFEFEIEVLVRAAWRGIEVKQIPVKVFYPKAEDRISHFRPMRDFFRISVLNTVLFPLALIIFLPLMFFRNIKRHGWKTFKNLLFAPHEPVKTKALSVGFGIFMGIIPIWGFQLMVAIPLAVLFRLNKVLVIIAANISIPPMIPLIFFLSNLCGMPWLGDKAQFIPFPSNYDWDSIVEATKLAAAQYYLGACTLAVLAGVLSYVIIYYFLKSRNNSILAGDS